MAVLYRKYRPQTFSDVLGQKHIVQTLKNQIAGDSISHAYLFTGSRGIGKTSIARILAKAVNCLKVKAGEPCGECDICTQIEAGSFLDLVEIDAASNTGVDNIRELIEHVKFSPSLGRYKVFILDEVHMLSKGAFNALLKTLEEPPAHAIFILATTEINKVPATIISRTQRFDFKAYTQGEILQQLQKIIKQEKLKIKPEILNLIAQNAQGGMRDALSLLDKVATLGEDSTIEESQQLLGITDIALCENLLQLIVSGSSKDIPEFFESLLEKGQDFTIFNRDFLEFLRKVLIAKVTGGTSVNEKISQFASQIQLPELIFIIRLFLKSYKDLPSSPSLQIPLLLASLEAATKKDQTSSVRDGLRSITTMAPTVMSMNTAVDERKKIVQVTEEMVIIEPIALETATIEEVQKIWPAVINKIKIQNSPLASLIRVSPLLSVTGGRIVLGVKFLFDKQTLESPKNQTMLRQTVEEVLKKKLGITGTVLKTEEKNTTSTAEALTDALKIFGGEIIE